MIGNIFLSQILTLDNQKQLQTCTMTIYSGFPTRKLEERYNNLLTQAFELLSQLIITYVEHSKIQPFEKHFRKLYSNMQKMEQLKHLQPKFSLTLKPLSQHVTLADERTQTLSQGTFLQPPPNNQKKRPMTSNNFERQRKHSIDLQRKTISVIPEQNRPNREHRYRKQQNNKFRHHSFSAKHSTNLTGYREQKQKQFELGANLTMEELMEKNRLVERKMTLFRKKKQLQVAKFGKIQELDEEDDPTFL